MRRLRRRPVVGVLALAVVAGLVLLPRHLGTDDGRPQASGPAPGRFVADWDTRVGDGAPLGYDEPTGSVLLWYSGGIGAPNRLFALDAGTGRKRWEGGPPGWGFEISYLPDDFVLGGTAVLPGNDPQGVFALAGIDVRDGGLLWSRPLPVTHPEIAFSGDFVAARTNDRTVVAYGASDGDERWRWSAGEGCTVEAVRGSAELVVAETLCGGDRHLRSLDTSGGQERWSRRIGTGRDGAYGPNWGVRGGLIGLSRHPETWAYNADGALVFTHPRDATCSFAAACFAATGDVGLLTYGTGDRAVLQAVDLRDGTTLWRHRMAAEVLQIRGDSVHVYGRFPAPVLPHFLATVDLRSGDYRLSATPGPATGSGGDFVAVLGDRVVLNEELDRFTAYRTEPSGAGFFGGAPARHWPDACRLLDPRTVADTVPDADRYQEVPERVEFLGTRLPRPTTCRYLPEPVSGSLATVAVAWVARTEGDARRLMDRFVGDGGVVQHPGTGDAAAQTVPFQGQQQQTVYVRVGRHLLAVTVDGRAADRAPDLARAAADALRRSTEKRDPR